MKLHYHELGEGAPLVLLHGLFGSLTNWLGVSRELATRYHVFAVDQRNHGRSPHSPDMSYPQLAADLGEFLDGRGVTAAHVLGHSMGGKVAMQFALTHPARVRRLIVADISPRARPPQFQEIFTALMAVNPSEFKTRAALDAALAERLPDPVLRRFLLKNIKHDETGELQWQMHLAGIQANYDELRAAVQGGRPFAKPALFLQGENSHYVGEGDMAEIRRLFPEARIQVVIGAGHWLHADAPVEFTRAVLDFLDEP